MEELLALLEELNKQIKSAEASYRAAVEEEQMANDETQDILHTYEFAPSTIPEDFDLTQTLRDIRERRRVAKQHLEIATQFKNYCEKNKAAVDQITQLLGNMRKIMEKQPFYHYCYKTNVIGKKYERLVHDDEEEIVISNAPVQTKFQLNKMIKDALH